MREITIQESRDMIIAACDAIIAAKDLLTEVDSKIGDGDHGIGMSGGMEKVKQALLEKETWSSVNEIFKVTGMQILNFAGGASGAVFGSMFLGGAEYCETVQVLDGYIFTGMMRMSLESVQNRGKADVGDKTMVDALKPAVLAMEEVDSDDLAAVLRRAWEASKEGVESTKAMTAKFGRAKSLMERAVGYQDAGATSVSIIFEAMYEYAANL